MENPPEPSETSLKDGDSSTKSSTGVRTRYSQGKKKEELNLRYTGAQIRADPIIRKHLHLVARKIVRIATEGKEFKTFEQKKWSDFNLHTAHGLGTN